MSKTFDPTKLIDEAILARIKKRAEDNIVETYLLKIESEIRELIQKEVEGLVLGGIDRVLDHINGTEQLGILFKWSHNE